MRVTPSGYIIGLQIRVSWDPESAIHSFVCLFVHSTDYVLGL